jgi:hypothetical protein
MIEKLLELEDIVLYPSELNNGYQIPKYNFGVIDDLDKSSSLPIFTSPSDAVVDKTNWRTWAKEGIRPVLPRTEDIDVRLDGCQYIFAAFSLPEVKEHFISRGKRNSQYQFRVCIDCGNGGDIEIFNTATQLKKIYGPQINIMAGNIGNPKTYINYCKAGIDYVRVGISSGSLVDYEKYGFYYPMAQLLIDILGLRNTSCAGLKCTKIIADGGIGNPVDILKCLALGADYVMGGRMFVRLIEAAGPIHRKALQDGVEFMEEISREDAINSLSELGPKDAKLKRLYCGNTTYETQAKRAGYSNVDDWMDGGCKTKPSDSKIEWVSVSGTLKTWLLEMYDRFNYAFAMSNAVDWKTYKQNIKYGRTQ